MDRPKLKEEMSAAPIGVSPDALGGDLLYSRAAAESEADGWFAPFVRAHTRRVFALLYRMVANAGDAQDLCQEVFLKAYQRRDQLRDPARATQWLLRIATNAAIDFQRSRLPHRTGLSLGDDAHTELRDTLRSPSPSPEQQALGAERQRRLWAALEVLSPKERAAVVLRDLEGLPNQEVAATLGCSMITVRTHIASARVKMRKFLLREGPV
jgi:RNA polymerase sigma-70 factor (ECF subfamily)